LLEQQYWIWPVASYNWNVVKERNIWATYSKSSTKKVKKGDVIIFYLVGQGRFSGIFEVKSEWYENKSLVWTDEIQENRKLYPYECMLESIKTGTAPLAELVQRLSFIGNKSIPGAYLMGTHGGPANFARPIPVEDYKVIFDSIVEEEKPQPPIEHEDLEHDEVVARLLEVGYLLGLDVSDSYEDRYVAKGAVVDAVWKLRIGTLGEIRYVFEVQLGGSVDSLLLNLIKSVRNTAVRTLIIVTTIDQLQKIVSEADELPEDIKRRLRFITTDELNKAYENLKRISEFREKLGLQV